jgi:nucleotide-binding universal stress UspA family protein
MITEDALPIRTILVVVQPLTQLEITLDGALGLAKRMEGHLEVLLLQPDPAELFADYPHQGIPNTEELGAVNARRSIELQARFEAWRDDRGLPASIVDTMLGSVYARWTDWKGPPVSGFLRWGRLADLIVMAAPGDRPGLGAALLEAALFGSGRPVLVLPGPVACPLLARVAVAWNSSLPAVHGLAAAMPFLHEAEQVDIFAVAAPHDAESDPSMIAAADVVEALSWQGVRARAVHPDILEHENVGAALLREAAALDVSLMALGAFMHSRIGGEKLDGVTGWLLKNARIPLLMTA